LTLHFDKLAVLSLSMGAAVSVTALAGLSAVERVNKIHLLL
jgi:hypothetical protein